MQYMVPCYGRPPLVNPDVSYKDYDYYEEIKIFPASEDSIYVFKYDSNSMDYYLLESYKQIYWKNDSIAVPFILLMLPPPQTVKWNEPKFLLSLLKMNLLAMRYVFICNLIFLWMVVTSVIFKNGWSSNKANIYNRIYGLYVFSKNMLHKSYLCKVWNILRISSRSWYYSWTFKYKLMI